MPAMLEQITLQPQVRDLLLSTVAAGRATHAYLFSGPQGSGKLDVACAFAQALVCEDQGCGHCIDCKKALLRNHPDIRVVHPAGAQGYLIEQIREVVSDATRAPIQAKHKVFILEDVEQLGTSAANAFLKTLEEPSSRVTLILLTSRQESVLSTILSRCQVVAFRSVPEADLVAELVRRVGCQPSLARVAVNVSGGSLDLAETFCRSEELIDLRKSILKTLENLEASDDWMLLKAASALSAGGESILDDLKAQQAEELEVAGDFLGRGALKQMEAGHKRALTAMTRQLFRLRCSVVESWLRDVLLVKAGCNQLLINDDARQAILACAQSVSETGLLCACDAVTRCKSAMDYNVQLQICLDALLLEVREDLYGPHNSR